jgi:hypothetical protein
LAVNVLAHHQKPFGMKLLRHAHALQIHSVTIVPHAHHQEYGITKTILVTVYHQKLFGMELNVFAHQTDSDHHVLNAQLQDIGMSKAINVLV